MFPPWRSLCLHGVIRHPSISRVADSRDGSVSLLTVRIKFRSHITIQQRCGSQLVTKIRDEGFRTPSGVLVESDDTVELEDGNFLRVKEVLHKEHYNSYEVLGWRFVRNRKTFGLPRVDLNEVYWVVHLIKDDPQPAAVQALVKVDGSQVLRKRAMTIVNKIHPYHQEKPGADLGTPGDGALSCRWKHVIVTKTRKLNRPLDAFTIHAAEISEAGFHRLLPEECDEFNGKRIADEKLRQSWVGAEENGASIMSRAPTSLESAVEALSLDSDSRKNNVPAAYTFADVCCGAGGASRGAEMAGLLVRWALDHNDPACKTYHLNFPKVQLFQNRIQDVIHMKREDLQVDIMHFSPPCQAFSEANTTPNRENDLLNIAANMAIADCLEATRPTIVTIEQTPGLVRSGYRGKHNEHWDNIINQFTSKGYSVAWKIINLAELGAAQHRKRLIMIASCPGEPLPPFPKPTHSKYRGTSDFKSIPSVKDVIGHITLRQPDHKIPDNFRTPHEPYDENMPLHRVIPTEPSGIYHPSGLRAFSLRELACIQGFPLKHRFDRTSRISDTKVQIGNAFPSPAAAALYKVIRKHLKRRDRWKRG